ncbi:glutathione S-transferase N-terminal domain-containing protein [Candidatus Micrarchaeota archaeon]|nr:glutathione S-transferase N-terminal domain-containing protein [Candidatus Micrarchaeota archaeon]
MANKVIVYSAEWCPWCHRVMDFLKQNNVAFEMKDVDLPANAQESFKKSNQGGIPVTDINGTIVVGFDVKKIKELLNIA